MADGDGAWYQQHISAYEQAFSEWGERNDKVRKRFRDEGRPNKKAARFNLLTSNVQTILPALYARTPVPAVERRWRTSDPIARAAETILERTNRVQLSSFDFDQVMRSAVMERLLYGRGQAWLRYDPTFQPTGATNEDGTPAQALADEHVRWDFLQWQDFGHSVARAWAEVRCVWRHAYYSPSKAKNRFPDHAERIAFDQKPKGGNTGAKADATLNQARITEIWDKEANQVAFLNASAVLDITPPPFSLQDFFPCPKPLYGVLTPDSLVPVQDYHLYRDQLEQIDEMTARIALLQDAIRLAGVYAADQKALLAQLVNGELKNVLIPVENWAALTDRGGVKGIMDFVPLDMVLEAIEACQKVRAQQIQDVYEITGISDILRGQTNPNETLGAQELKAQQGGRRLSDSQAEVQRFARDIVRIQSEAIAEAFSDKTLARASGLDPKTILPDPALLAYGVPPTEDQADFAEAVALLRDEPRRNFTLDIETDSTIAMDEGKEKADRSEFVEKLTGFLQTSVQILTSAGPAAPAILPLLGEAMKFGAAGFRAGRQLESAIEECVAKLDELVGQGAMTPPAPPGAPTSPPQAGPHPIPPALPAPAPAPGAAPDGASALVANPAGPGA